MSRANSYLAARPAGSLLAEALGRSVVLLAGVPAGAFGAAAYAREYPGALVLLALTLLVLVAAPSVYRRSAGWTRLLKHARDAHVFKRQFERIDEQPAHRRDAHRHRRAKSGGAT